MTTPSDQLPPHSLPAEESLLGSLVVAGSAWNQNREAALEAIAILSGPEAFFNPRYADAYRCILKVIGESDAIDVVQLVEASRSFNRLDTDLWTELVEAVPTAVNAPHYARIVEENYRKRRVVDVADAMIAQAHKADAADEIIANAMLDCAAIANGGREETCSSDADILSDLVAEIKLGKPEDVVLTGFPDLDFLLGGMRGGQLIVVAARPGMGKSAWALDLANNAANQGTSSALFTLEMTRKELGYRMMAKHTGIDSQQLQSWSIRDMRDGSEKMRKALDAVCNRTHRIMIDDLSGLSLEMLALKARRHVAAGAKLLVVDYLQLMAFPKANREDEAIGKVTSGMKLLAKELDVPIVLLSQLNRGVEARENKRPHLSDLRGSGTIEQDANAVLFLYRKAYYSKTAYDGGLDPTEVIVAKNRGGSVGTAVLGFLRPTATFKPLAPDVVTEYLEDQG